MNTLTIGRKKKELKPNEQLARTILEQYQPKSVADMQNALKDIFGPMFEAMLQVEMNQHLGYEKNVMIQGSYGIKGILYIETYGKHLCLHTRQGNEVIKMSVHRYNSFKKAFFEWKFQNGNE